MQALTDILAFLAGTPAVVGPVVTALIIYLTSNWRIALLALLGQYLLVGLGLAQRIQPEVAFVKILVGILAVLILYLTARRLQEEEDPNPDKESEPRILGMHVGWMSGPLGLPLRLLSVFLVILALVRLFDNYQLALVPVQVALVASWLGAMGMLGLVLSGGPLRVAYAFLTILTGFDLVYATLEPSLAVVGFFSAFTLLASLAFSYLASVHGLAASQVEVEESEL
jgi:MFS family permease